VALSWWCAVLLTACSGPTPPAEPTTAPWKAATLPRLEVSDLRALAAADTRPVVLAFWASWCGPCLEDFPRLSQLHASGRARVIGLATEDPETASPAIEGALNRIAPAFPQGLAAPSPDVLLAAFGLRWTGILPAHLVLNAVGAARGPFVGAWNDAHLEPTPPTGAPR
jgi:thiol-disulfide isomerase/thioredoxin